MATALVLLALLCTALQGKAQECTNGEVKIESIALHGDSSTERDYPQYCFNGKWRMFCTNDDTWVQTTATVLCKQLGYNGQSAFESARPDTQTRNFVRPRMACNGSEERVQDCSDHERPLRGQNDCNNDNIGWIQCQKACTNEEIRLVGGSTNREGRVELCMEGRWGTVCNSDPEEYQLKRARFVCRQLGFSTLGAEATNTYSPGIVPIHECTLNEGSLNCTQLADASCDHTMDLGVVCRTCQESFETLLDQCSSTVSDQWQSIMCSTCPQTEQCQPTQCPPSPAPKTCPPTAESPTCTCPPMTCPPKVCPTTPTPSQITCPPEVTCPPTTNPNSLASSPPSNPEPSRNCVSPGAMGGVVGILLVLLITLAVGWTLTCVAIWNRNLIKRKPTKTDPTEPSTCTTNRQFANPVYDSTTDNNYSSSGPTYELVDANDGPTATYSVIERDHMTPEPTAEDEDHTYHVLEAGPAEEGACDYEVPVSRHSQVPLCEQEYSTLQH